MWAGMLIIGILSICLGIVVVAWDNEKRQRGTYLKWSDIWNNL